jgi:hypothetical protein
MTMKLGRYETRQRTFGAVEVIVSSTDGQDGGFGSVFILAGEICSAKPILNNRGSVTNVCVETMDIGV